ncbi:MAG: ribonuclease P protein subunit [archaeon]
MVRHELIGLHAKVVQAENSANLGLSGKVVDESFKTLVIETRKGDKRIFKSGVVLQLELPGREKVEIAGELLVARPWDRIKKKISKW